jgi:hypothetical protein
MEGRLLILEKGRREETKLEGFFMKTFSTSIGVWIQVKMLQSMVSDPSIN